MEKKYVLRAEKSLVHYSGLKKDFKKPCVPNSLQPRQTVFWVFWAIAMARAYFSRGAGLTI